MSPIFGFSAFDSLMFTAIPFVVTIGFIVILGIFLVTIISGAKQWNQNNNSPVLTVQAKVVAKRNHVRRHRHNHAGTHMNHTSYSNTYFVTFEVDSGDRIELCVPDSEFGMLVEGDIGQLTFQGTRYKGFERSR